LIAVFVFGGEKGDGSAKKGLILQIRCRAKINASTTVEMLPTFSIAAKTHAHSYMQIEKKERNHHHHQQKHISQTNEMKIN